jgi:predicted HAD superfamily Cof-like phosphohydrolase
MRSKTQSEYIEEFMDEAQQPLLSGYDSKLFAFRMALVAEEFKELAESAGEYMAEHPESNLQENTIRAEHVLKELCDCLYVLQGMAVTFGWDVDEAFKRVHESNMTKLPFKKTDDGKVMKGPNYKPCDLGGLV